VEVEAVTASACDRDRACTRAVHVHPMLTVLIDCGASFGSFGDDDVKLNHG
jgi:hypothetical protein